MKNPFFSIIIPTYNRANTIIRAVNSVQNQLFQDWELLVVDDGSKDNTAQLVRSVCSKDNRVKYFYQENAERSTARNYGVSKSSGKYICFLDSDDTYSDNHLKMLNEAITENRNQNFIYIVKSTILNVSYIKVGESDIHNGNSDYETIVLNTITPGQFCVPRELLDKEKFDTSIRISEDTDLLFRIARWAKLKILNQHTHEYLQHDDNSVNPKKYNAYAERYKTLEKIFAYPEAIHISKKLRRKILSDCFLGIQRFYSAKREFFKARVIMIWSIIKYPDIRLKEKIYLVLFPKKVHQ